MISSYLIRSRAHYAWRAGGIRVMIIMNTDAPHGGRSVDLKSYTYNKEDNGLTIFRYTTWESYFLMLLRRKRVQSRILTTVCIHHFYQGQIMLHKTQTTLNIKYQLKKIYNLHTFSVNLRRTTLSLLWWVFPKMCPFPLNVVCLQMAQ